MKKFVLLSSQRSGSTYISLWLNGHPQIESHGEVFLRSYSAPDGFTKYCNRSFYTKFYKLLFHNRITEYLKINLIPYRVIDSFLNSLFHNPNHSGAFVDIRTWNTHQARKLGAECIGFKLMYSQLAVFPQLFKWLQQESDIHILHLVRTNHLKTFVSNVRKAKTGIAHTEKDVPTKPVFIDSTKLLKFIQRQEESVAFYRIFFSSRYHYCEFSTEDFFSDRDAIKNNICKFFNISRHAMPAPGLKKISSSNMKNEIINYQEVMKVLSASKYQYMLNSFQLPAD